MKVAPVLVAATALAAPSAAQDLSLQITVSKEANDYGDHDVTITPSDPTIPYVWFFETVESFENDLGGIDGVVEAKLKEWELYASLYDDTWKFFRDLDSDTGTATKNMYTKWGSDPKDGEQYYVIAYGIDDDKNLTYPVTIAPFPPADEPEGPAFTIELSDFTPLDCHISITPREDVGTWYYYITTPASIERNGGINNVDVAIDRGWWEFVAEAMQDPTKTWVDYIAADLEEGPVSGMVSELEVTDLAWKTTFVVYAYGLNLQGERTTDIIWKEFTMPDRNHSDITFDVWLHTKELDENKSNSLRDIYTMTFDIMPSNEDETFCVYRIFSTTWDNRRDEDQTDENWMAYEFWPYATKNMKGYVRVNLEGIDSYHHDYYLVIAGHDEFAPTTEPVLFRFTTDDEPTGLQAVSRDEIVVLPGNGGIHIYGAYQHVTIYGMDGKTVAVTRGKDFVELPAGLYIVNVAGEEGTVIKKVMIK